MNSSNVNNTSDRNNNQTDDLLILDPIPSIVSDEKSLKKDLDNDDMIPPGQTRPILSLIEEDPSDKTNNVSFNEVLKSEPILDLIEEVPNNTKDDDFIKEQPIYDLHKTLQKSEDILNVRDDVLKLVKEEANDSLNNDLSEMNSLNNLLQPAPIPSLRGSKQNLNLSDNNFREKVENLELNSSELDNNLDNSSSLGDVSSNSDSNLIDIDIDVSDDLLLAYVGVNYNKIINTKFSISGFFLGFIYLFYRKMYIIASVVMIVNILLFLLNLSIITILINVVVAFMFKYVYISCVKNNVKRIINENKDKTNDELVNICSKIGGTSIIGVILGVIIEIIILIIAVGNVFNSNDVIINNDENVGQNVNSNENVEIKEFDGIIYSNDDVEKIEKYFDINVPIFFEQEKNSYSYKYISDGDEIYNKCEFTFSLVENFDDASSLAKQMSNYYNGNQVRDKVINNIEWKVFSTTDLSLIKYYYFVNVSEKLYMATYTIESDEEDSICETYHTDIMNDISLIPNEKDN